MNTRLIIILSLVSLLLCRALAVSARQPALFTVRGVLLDSASRKPVAFVTIRALNAGQKLIKETLTKEDGAFMIERLPAGKYSLEFTAVGYRVKAVSLTLDPGLPAVYNTGDIFISTVVKSLEEVKVVARKSLVKQEIDRITYDIQGDPESQGSSMLDMMAKVPLLSMDGQDKILLKGSPDYKILINGHPSNMLASNPAMALRMMKAENVLRVEVITTPSSKYDAEGMAGIINIVTKSPPAGYNVILEAFDNTRIYEGVGGAFEVKDGKLGVNGYVGAWRKNFGRNLFSNEVTPSNWTQPGVEQSGNSRIHGPNTPASLDLSFDFDSLDLLTASAAMTLDNAALAGSQNTNSFDSSHELVQAFGLSNVSTTQKNDYDINVNYQRGFKANKERLLTFSYSYARSAVDYAAENNTLTSFNYNTQLLKQKNNNGYNFNTFQLDYVGPLKKISMEGGIKAILRENYSDFHTDTYISGPPAQISNVFNYQQNVYSAYNSYLLKGVTWGFKAGARLELTTVNGGGSDKDYLNLIPSIAVQHKLKNAQSLNFGYTERVQRPNITQLNSFENQTNPFFYTSGNPNLVPVASHNFDLNYTRTKKLVTNISLNYILANKTIQNVVIQEADSIGRSTYANIGKYSNLGGNLSISYPITRQLMFTLNGRFQYLWLRAMVDNQGYRNQGTTGDVTGNVTYRFKNDWIYTFRFSAYTNTVNLQGSTGGFCSAYTRLTKEFFNRKLGVIASLNNPLSRYRRLATDYRTDASFQRYIENNDIRAVYLNIYYTFGHLREKIRKNTRNINNDDLEKEKKPE